MEEMLDKKKVDEAIRLNQKYYKTSDVDIARLSSRANEDAFGLENSYWLGNILSAITVKYGTNYDEPYDTYYDVLEVLGFTIVYDEQEQE